jgi:hypothetical protein
MSDSLIPLYILTQNHTRVPYVAGYSCNIIENGHFVFYPESVFRKQYLKLQGQIHRGTGFGEFLFTLARSGPSKWIEIGSWNGLGSTKCILDGFHAARKTDARLLSFELDPIMCGVAQENLAAHPLIGCVSFINQRLSSGAPTYFPTVNDIAPDEQKEHFVLYYERERALFHASQGYRPQFSPEVALLDGGEYSGYNDWLQLDKSALQWICIDDTSALKSRKIVEILKADSQWLCMYDSDERYGWAVFKHVNAPFLQILKPALNC